MGVSQSGIRELSKLYPFNISLLYSCNFKSFCHFFYLYIAVNTWLKRTFYLYDILVSLYDIVKDYEIILGRGDQRGGGCPPHHKGEKILLYIM
jgi:hypothetical protein